MESQESGDLQNMYKVVNVELTAHSKQLILHIPEIATTFPQIMQDADTSYALLVVQIRFQSKKWIIIDSFLLGVRVSDKGFGSLLLLNSLLLPRLPLTVRDCPATGETHKLYTIELMKGQDFQAS